MSVQNCFDNIIGLTKIDNDCLSVDAPTGYNITKSGLYLDELEGINLKVLDESSEPNIDLWDMMNTALLGAVGSFRVDTMQQIMLLNKLRRDAWHGQIGTAKFTYTKNVTQKYAGIRLFCNHVKDGFFRLKGIGLAFNISATFDVSLYSNFESTPLYTWSVTSVANKYTVFNLPSEVLLYLTSNDIEATQYFFVYELSGGLLPKDNLIDTYCCGSRWCFNPVNPCFGNERQIKNRWTQWLMAGGIVGDDISDLTDELVSEWPVSQYANGLTLIGDLDCETFNILCNENTDFANDEIGVVTAYAIRFKAGFNLMKSLLSTTQLNRYTMMNREQIIEQSNYYQKEYMDRCAYIGAKIDVYSRGCIACNKAYGYGLKTNFL